MACEFKPLINASRSRKRTSRYCSKLAAWNEQFFKSTFKDWRNLWRLSTVCFFRVASRCLAKTSFSLFMYTRFLLQGKRFRNSLFLIMFLNKFFVRGEPSSCSWLNLFPTTYCEDWQFRRAERLFVHYNCFLQKSSRKFVAMHRVGDGDTRTRVGRNNFIPVLLWENTRRFCTKRSFWIWIF